MHDHAVTCSSSSSFSFPSLRTTSSNPLPIFLPSTSPCLLSYSHLFSLFFFSPFFFSPFFFSLFFFFFLFSSSPIYRSSRLVIECSFTSFFCTETRPSFSFSFLLVSIYLLWQPRACFKIVCMLSDTNFKPRKAVGNWVALSYNPNFNRGPRFYFCIFLGGFWLRAGD